MIIADWHDIENNVASEVHVKRFKSKAIGINQVQEIFVHGYGVLFSSFGVFQGSLLSSVSCGSFGVWCGSLWCSLRFFFPWVFVEVLVSVCCGSFSYWCLLRFFLLFGAFQAVFSKNRKDRTEVPVQRKGGPLAGHRTTPAQLCSNRGAVLRRDGPADGLSGGRAVQRKGAIIKIFEARGGPAEALKGGRAQKRIQVFRSFPCTIMRWHEHAQHTTKTTTTTTTTTPVNVATTSAAQHSGYHWCHDVFVRLRYAANCLWKVFSNASIQHRLAIQIPFGNE